MRYQLVIFDWDGTLMDSALKIVRCFQAAARDSELPVPSAQDVHDIIGLGLHEAYTQLYPDRPNDQKEFAIERYRQHFLHFDQTEMPLFAGVMEGLQELYNGGLRLAVATGKARRGLDRVMNETGTRDFFVATRCSDETFSKPHPQMLLDLLEITQVQAEAAVMIGDSVHDMEMARRAGIDPVGVTYGVHPQERLATHSPLACLNSFREVRDWLLDQPASRELAHSIRP